MAMEGSFPISKLGLLTSDQQQFVEAFLVARGNIKEVEKELGISYPTVRKKLDEVIDALGYAPHAERREQLEILEAIEQWRDVLSGRLSQPCKHLAACP